MRTFVAKSPAPEIYTTAWWAPEDSNLQPDRYERGSGSRKARKFRRIRRRLITFVRVRFRYFMQARLAADGERILGIGHATGPQRIEFAKQLAFGSRVASKAL